MEAPLRKFRNGVLLALAAVSALAFADPSKLPQPEFKQVIVAGGALVTGTVDTNTDLGNLSTVYTKRVTRLGTSARGDSPATDFIASGSACSLNAGNGDGTTQIKSADNKCWLSVTATVTPALSTAYYDAARSNGWFASGDNKSASAQLLAQSENQLGKGTTGFRDGLFIQHRDGDTSNYQPEGYQKVSNGLRVMTTGAYSGGAFSSQTKDIVGIDSHAIARITGWPDRGVSGIAVGAIQYGEGIASNEFAVENPTGANEQSKSMAAVQAILRPHKADVDGSHFVTGALVENSQGFLATAGLRVISTAHPSISARDGAFQYGLDMRTSLATSAGIRMPDCRSASAACSIIDYKTNYWTDLSSNVYRWIANGNVKMQVSDTGVAFNGSAPTGKCTLSAALPTDGSATNANIAIAINAVRTCLITNGLAQ